MRWIGEKLFTFFFLSCFYSTGQIENKTIYLWTILEAKSQTMYCIFIIRFSTQYGSTYEVVRVANTKLRAISKRYLTKFYYTQRNNCCHSLYFCMHVKLTSCDLRVIFLHMLASERRWWLANIYNFYCRDKSFVLTINDRSRRLKSWINNKQFFSLTKRSHTSPWRLWFRSYELKF